MLSSDKVTIKKRIYNFSVGKMQGEMCFLRKRKTHSCPPNLLTLFLKLDIQKTIRHFVKIL